MPFDLNQLDLTRLDQSSFAFLSLIGQPGASIKTALFTVHFVLGVPPSTLGANNDYALRGDGAAGASTTLYHREAGSWTACTL